MARVEFNDLIRSASGVISRRRMPDGTVHSIVVNKRGTLYETTYHPRTKISPEEIARRRKFGIICSAVAIVQKELHLPSDPETRKRVYAVMGDMYDKMLAHDKIATPESLATMYAYMCW